MFKVMIGQDGDDFIFAERPSLPGAETIAKNQLKKIKEQNLPTNIYILTPEGGRIPPLGFSS